MTGGRESSRGASRRGAWMAAAVLAFGGIGFAARRQTTRAFDGGDVRRLVIAQADSLDASLAALRDALSTASGSSNVGGPPPGVRLAFRRARAQYKHVEGVVEFYAPALAAAFNSRRQEVDDDDAPPPSLLAPSGFPVLESLLWPSEGSVPTTTFADSGRRLVDAMRPLVGRVRGLATGIQPTDAQVIELTRLELVRVTTLGIVGFDAPRSRDAMAECAEALDGIRELYMVVGGRWPAAAARRRRLDASLSAASANLRTHADFTTFDRLDFLVGYANAAAVALASLRLTAGIVPLIMPRGLRATAVSPYAAGAFDVRAYAPRSAPSESPVLIELGERLFGDPRLSGPRTRSCASCHVPSRAFADGRATPATLVPGMRVPRNTPTLINVGLQPAQFADERAV